MKKELKKAIEYFNMAADALTDKKRNLVEEYQSKANTQLNKVTSENHQDQVNYVKAVSCCRLAYLYILQSDDEAAHQQFDLAFLALNSISQEKITPSMRVFFAQSHCMQALKYHDSKNFHDARITIKKAIPLIDLIPEEQKTIEHHLLQFCYKGFSILLKFYMGKMDANTYREQMEGLFNHYSEGDYFKGEWSKFDIKINIQCADEVNKAKAMLDTLFTELDSQLAQHSILNRQTRRPDENPMPLRNVRTKF